MCAEASLIFATIKHWVAKYKRDRTSVFDKERSGHPKIAITDDRFDLVYQIVIMVFGLNSVWRSIHGEK